MSGAVQAVCCCDGTKPVSCPASVFDIPGSACSSGHLTLTFSDVDVWICLDDGTTCTETISGTASIDKCVADWYAGEGVLNNAPIALPADMTLTSTYFDSYRVVAYCDDDWSGCIGDGFSRLGLAVGLEIKDPNSCGGVVGSDTFLWIYLSHPSPMDSDYQLKTGSYTPQGFQWLGAAGSASSDPCGPETIGSAPSCSDTGGSGDIVDVVVTDGGSHVVT